MPTGVRFVAGATARVTQEVKRMPDAMAKGNVNLLVWGGWVPLLPFQLLLKMGQELIRVTECYG